MDSRFPNLKLKNVLLDNTRSEDEKKKKNSNTANDLGLTLERLNLGPRKKLIVLDLDGLLVHRIYLRESISGPNIRLSYTVCGNFRVYKRPYFDEFLKFCFERFYVGIWSSAMKHNIEGALQTVMGGLRRKLLYVWDQEKCTYSGFGSLEKKEKPIFLKELKKVWENNSFLGQFSSSNTLLIDDDPYKALLNPPNTAIFPKKCKVENWDDTFLGPKGELRLYLEGLADAESVACYVKEHPFGQPAITPLHSEWGYYSKIVRHFR